jgi:hypothetical protein
MLCLASFLQFLCCNLILGTYLRSHCFSSVQTQFLYDVVAQSLSNRTCDIRKSTWFVGTTRVRILAMFVQSYITELMLDVLSFLQFLCCDLTLGVPRLQCSEALPHHWSGQETGTAPTSIRIRWRSRWDYRRCHHHTGGDCGGSNLCHGKMGSHWMWGGIIFPHM